MKTLKKILDAGGFVFFINKESDPNNLIHVKVTCQTKAGKYLQWFDVPRTLFVKTIDKLLKEKVKQAGIEAEKKRKSVIKVVK